MKITLRKSDTVFSQYIRLRDGQCMRCGSQVELNAKDLPVSHQASHYFGRGKESTRFDPENVDALCAACHVRWGGTDREDYRNFKVKQLGQQGFDLLTLRANTTGKRDDVMALMMAKELLKTVKVGV